MKRHETRAVPATTRQVCIGRICDLCGRESKSEDWTGDRFVIDETTVRAKIEIARKEGSNYPDGGSGTEYEIDLCPACFQDRLVPWLIGQGARIKTKEWDW